MKKGCLRIVALVLVLTILLSMAAFAAMTESDYIAATSAWITRSGNTVKVNFYIVGTKTMDKIGVQYVYLYEKTGNTWYLVETFDYTDPDYAADMMNTNSGAKAAYLSYDGSSTKSYYATCYFYAEKNGGSDSITQNTPTSHGSSTPTP